MKQSNCWSFFFNRTQPLMSWRGRHGRKWHKVWMPWERGSYALLPRCVCLHSDRIVASVDPVVIFQAAFPFWCPVQVKRRYLDWRALTKKKQLQTELSLSSSPPTLAIKTEYENSSPEHEAPSLGSGCDQLLDLSGFPKDWHCDWPEMVALSESSGQAAGALPGVKMEDDVSEYRVTVCVCVCFFL